MACKTFFENLYEKFSEISNGDNVGKCYEFLCYLFFDFEEA